MAVYLGDRGFPPVGRRSVGPDEAKALLVDDTAFASSRTRPVLWGNLERYLDRFFQLEDQYAELIGEGALVPMLWLGGSFVSAKVDPGNIDATVFVDDDARIALRGKPGAAWVNEAFNRKSCEREFGVSALRVGYRRAVNVFDTRSMAPEDTAYFRDRGIWDDWWQRCRLDPAVKTAPTKESAVPVRGYLEVTL